MSPVELGDFAAIIPALVLALLGLASLMVGAFFERHGAQMSAWLAAVGFIAAGAVCGVAVVDAQTETFVGFGETLAADPLAYAFILPCTIAGVLTVLLSLRYLRRLKRGAGELCGLLVLATAGMAVMLQAQDLIVAFFGLELLSIPLYILAAYSRESAGSNEAGMKYLLVGALGSAVMVYGIALVYAYFGTTSFAGLAEGSAARSLGIGTGFAGLPAIGLGLIAVGLCFKAAVAPFHLWCPDVYQGASTPITAFFSVGPKIAALGLMYRLFLSGFGDAAGLWIAPLSALSALSMLVGNLGALRQTHAKRLLAYSSIAHAGYMLLAIVAAGVLRAADDATWARPAAALAFYGLAYALMNIGAFAVVTQLESDDRLDLPIERFRGYARRHPAQGLALTLFMVSLTGIPLTAGFLGKWLVLASVAEAAGASGVDVRWLIILAVLNSAVSAFYYIRFVGLAFVETEEKIETERWSPTRGAAWVMVIASIGVLGLAVYPQPLLNAADAIASSLLR